MSDTEFTGFDFGTPIETSQEQQPVQAPAPVISPEEQARMERVAQLDEALRGYYGEKPEPERPLTAQEVELLIEQKAQTLYVQQQQQQILSQFYGNFPDLVPQQQTVFKHADAIFEYQKRMGQPVDAWRATQIAAERVRQQLQNTPLQAEAPASNLKNGLNYSVSPMGQPVTPQIKSYDQMSREEFSQVRANEAARLGITPVR